MANTKNTQNLSTESKVQAQAAHDLFKACVESLPKQESRKARRPLLSRLATVIAALGILSGCAAAVDGDEEVTGTSAKLVTGLTVDDCPEGYNIIIGTEGRDIIVGTNGNDCILGLGGNDNISGKFGNDFIAGGAGDDSINGNQGDDFIFGEEGNDNINGGQTGNDSLYGGAGNDVIDGMNGDDHIEGGEGNDLIDGDLGDDSLWGGPGNDSIVDAAGVNQIDGEDGTDSCDGIHCEFAAAEQACSETVACGAPSKCNLATNLCVFCTTNAQCGNGLVCVPTEGCVGEQVCTDNTDDDGDGLTDCADADCETSPECSFSAFDFATPSDIAGGYHHQCILKDDGQVYCWGNNRHGELGYSTGKKLQSPVAYPVQGLNGTAVAVYAGETHSCAIMSDTTVRCWGTNNYGQLGDPSVTASMSVTPVTVAGVSQVAELALGQSHTCALIGDGTVQCWGANLNGQLGNGNMTESSAPSAVLNLNTSVHIAAGSLHTCAIKRDGNIVCWGAGSNGRLGNNSYTDTSLPASVDFSGTFDQITAGQAHTCARRTNGSVYCWGWNHRGQLGNASQYDRPSPTNVPGLSDVVRVSAGLQHTCALKTDGTVSCWGRNSDGQLGTTYAEAVTSPTLMNSMSNVRCIASGGSQTCAKTTDGAVFCWGDGQYGAIGTTTDSANPVSVTMM